MLTKIAQLKTVESFREHLEQISLELPCDLEILSAKEKSPLAAPLRVGTFMVGNRWCVQPMEGWDSLADGTPSEHTLRRWEHFGESGAKLIWGGEAYAVREDGRSNPFQCGVVEQDWGRAEKGIRLLYKHLLSSHQKGMGNTEDLLIGLQLTHSGRFSFPKDKSKRQPTIAYHHPILDRRCGIDPDDHSAIISDEELTRLCDDFVSAAKIAQKIGFQFVDLKHCHGYLAHELLGARTRSGKYGGSFENRTRFARELVEAVQTECPGLMIGIRLSAFDTIAYRPDPKRSTPGNPGPGIPEDDANMIPYLYGFGINQDDPTRGDLTEPIQFIQMMQEKGVKLWNLTCGSPYYNAHLQRPAATPPSDSYQPWEDPLIQVAQQIRSVQAIKDACPQSVFVGTGYTYLQDYLPHVAQAVVRAGWVDSVGLGRMILAYWEMPRDTLREGRIDKKRLCRTISDCTTAPRNGIISGCFPFDPYYKSLPENEQFQELKKTGGKK